MLIWLCSASFANHAFRTRFARELDRAAACACAAAICSLSVIRFVPLTALQESPNRFYSLYCGALWTVAIFTLMFFILFGEAHQVIATRVFWAFTNVPWIISVACFATRPILSGRVCWCSKSLLPQLMTYHRWIILSICIGSLGLILWYQPLLNNGNCPNIDGSWCSFSHGHFHICLAMASFCVWWYVWTEHELAETDPKFKRRASDPNPQAVDPNPQAVETDSFNQMVQVKPCVNVLDLADSGADPEV